MLSFHFIVLGKLKESYWRDAEEEYRKRLQPFAKIIIHELKEESFTEKDTPETIKASEAKKIKIEIEKIKPDYIIALDEHGTQYSSINFSTRLGNEAMNQNSNFVFIIGGPLGLDSSILKTAHLQLSFGKFTFTHQMVRVFLLEQLYRVMMIQHNRKYHY